MAANVLMDAARELRRTAARTASCTPVADIGAREADGSASTDAASELAEVLVDAVHDGTISWGDARLIAESRIAGTRVAAIAAHHGISTRTLWARRQRAELVLARRAS